MIVEELRRLSLLYVGTPYSKYPLGQDAAFVEAARVTARLMQSGLKVYSPIVHTHPMAVHGGIDALNHDIWLPFDRAMMDKSDAMIVVKMDEWERSVGLEHEIRVFIEAGKPIYFVSPTTLEFHGDEHK